MDQELKPELGKVEFYDKFVAFIQELQGTYKISVETMALTGLSIYLDSLLQVNKIEEIPSILDKNVIELKSHVEDLKKLPRLNTLPPTPESLDS
jgi:hypothetical protein